MKSFHNLAHASQLSASGHLARPSKYDSFSTPASHWTWDMLVTTFLSRAYEMHSKKKATLKFHAPDFQQKSSSGLSRII